MNTSWVLQELGSFIEACNTHSAAWDRHTDPLSDGRLTALRNDIDSRIPVIEEILNRAWPEWRTHLKDAPSFGGWEYEPLADAAMKAIAWLERRQELEENLGPSGPTLRADTLHSTVWSAASSLWASRHYADAVDAAARSVNAFLQNKVGRRDASDAGLVGECFSLKQPTPEAPRLRLMSDDSSKTYQNVHEGAVAFGRGCFTAIRNVLAHEFGTGLAEPPEQSALEYLAAFSVLARWIDSAEVIRDKPE